MTDSDQGSRWVPRGLRAVAVTLALTGVPVVLGAGPALAADRETAAPVALARPMIVTQILTNHILTAELVLLVLANVALVLAYGRYRRSLGDRRDAQATAAPDAVIGDPWMTPPPAPPQAAAPRPGAGRPQPRDGAGLPRRGASRPQHVDDYPSWPGRPGPYALHPDHPSWPGRPDPRWAATEAALRAEDHPRWPGRQAPPWRPAERPADLSEPGWPGPAGTASR
jgi:hypothetical protein